MCLGKVAGGGLGLGDSEVVGMKRVMEEGDWMAGLRRVVRRSGLGGRG